MRTEKWKERERERATGQRSLELQVKEVKAFPPTHFFSFFFASSRLEEKV